MILMIKQLSWIQKNLITAIPVVLVAGFFYGLNFDVSSLKSFIVPLTFLMVYPMMINLPLKKVFEGGDFAVQATTQFINFAVTPFIAYGIGLLFFPDNHYLALGLLLTGLLPTSGMTISWTGIAKGNMPAAVKMTIFGLIIGSVATPLYVKFFMGTTVAIDMLKVFKQIGVIVLIPLVLGNITQRLIIYKYGMAHYQEKLKKKFPPFSTLGVIGIVFVAMALKAKGVMESPATLYVIIIPLLLLYVVNFAISILVAKLFFKRGDGIALLYATVMRNLSIALAIAMTAFGKQGADVALVIALGYIIQVQLAAWIVKLTDKIFGPAPTATAQRIMHLGLFSLHDSKQLKDAIHLLAEEGISSIAILDSNEKVKGLLSMHKALNFIADEVSHATLLTDVALEPAITTGMQTPVAEIMKTMKRTHEYKVLISDAGGVVKGVVTERDILAEMGA